MAKVVDVSAFLLDKAGPMSYQRLTGLAYLAQVAGSVLGSEPFISDDVYATKQGPEFPYLYYLSSLGRDLTGEDVPQGRASELTVYDTNVLTEVMAKYEDTSDEDLAEIVLEDRDWQAARDLLVNSRAAVRVDWSGQLGGGAEQVVA